MKNCKRKTGLTLVEILIVVLIIGILAAIIIGIAARIGIQGKKQLTESTFALLDTALEQFRDYEYDYEGLYTGLHFPLDCNSFPHGNLEIELEDALLDVTDAAIHPGGSYDPNYSGSEAMYIFLSRIPESRQTLDRIDKSLVTNKGADGDDIIITIDGEDFPLFRVIDPWGETLRYSYYENTVENSPNEPPMSSPRAFPVITSAGPDKEFGSTDDIVSR